MSGYSPPVHPYKKYESYFIDLSFLESKIQESLDNGVDDDEDSIKSLIRYYTNGVKKIEVSYMRSCKFYVIKLKTVNDKTGKEYHYKFFIYSQR